MIESGRRHSAAVKFPQPSQKSSQARATLGLSARKLPLPPPGLTTARSQMGEPKAAKARSRSCSVATGIVSGTVRPAAFQQRKDSYLSWQISIVRWAGRKVRAPISSRCAEMARISWSGWL